MVLVIQSFLRRYSLKLEWFKIIKRARLTFMYHASFLTCHTGLFRKYGTSKISTLCKLKSQLEIM